MPESDVQAKEEAVKLRAPKLSAEKALPQSGADTLVRIIKGYAVASSGGQTKINYKDVASAAGIGPTIVSGNNKFLLLKLIYAQFWPALGMAKLFYRISLCDHSSRDLK